MKYVPNLIPEAYRVTLEQFQKTKKKKYIFPVGAIFPIVLLCLVVLGIFISKLNKNTIEQKITPTPSVDSLKQFSRKDSLNFHQKAAELAIQKYKWKTASLQFCKALEFASSPDSQYLLNQIAICKNRIRSFPRKPRPIIDSIKADSNKGGSSSESSSVDSLHHSSNSGSSVIFSDQSQLSKSDSNESLKANSSQSSFSDLTDRQYYAPYTRPLSNSSGYGSTYVHGYYRKDGTYVSGHTRISRK